MSYTVWVQLNEEELVDEGIVVFDIPSYGLAVDIAGALNAADPSKHYFVEED